MLVGCPNGGAPPDTALPTASVPARGGTVIIGVLGEPATLDPYSPLASELTGWLARPIYPSLFRMEPGGRMRPDLAESIEVEGDTAVVTLRRATWSDGTPISAADVVRSVRLAVEPSGLARIGSTQVVGPRKVRLRGSIGNWERALATYAFVVPRDHSERPLGTSGGPMTVSSRVEGLEVVYRPNPRWGGRPARLERVKVRFVVGLEMMVALLKRGRLDAAALPSSVNLDQRLDENALEHADVLGAETVYFDLDGAAPDLRYRARLIDAIDRSAIHEGLVRGDGQRIDVALPVRAPGSGPELRVQLAAPAGDELLILMQRIMQRHLESHGVTAELVSLDPRTYYGEWARTDPADIALRRSSAVRGVDRDLDRVPLFRVESVLAWRPGVLGLDPHPGLDGPLWNVEGWSI